MVFPPAAFPPGQGLQGDSTQYRFGGWVSVHRLNGEDSPGESQSLPILCVQGSMRQGSPECQPRGLDISEGTGVPRPQAPGRGALSREGDITYTPTAVKDGAGGKQRLRGGPQSFLEEVAEGRGVCLAARTAGGRT